MNFAVIGNPVEHSLSPALHNWVFHYLGFNAEYGKIKAITNELPRIIQTVRNGELEGINITIPHKRNIMDYLDEIDAQAEEIDAVNCVVRKGKKAVGYNTDWFGFKMALQKNSIDVSGRTCIILGAGGVARSILYALLNEGTNKILVANRTIEKAQLLVASFSHIRDYAVLEAISLDRVDHYLPSDAIIVNCTSVGMIPDTNATPLSKDCVNSSHILMDTIYTPMETRLLRDGKQAGAKTIGGLEMFIHQGLASLELWFGKDLVPQVNLKELRRYLHELCG